MPSDPIVRFPAEWESHAATWVTWPTNPDTWKSCLDAAQREFETLIRVIADFEDLHLLADPEWFDRLFSRFENHPRIKVYPLATNDCWIRDYGPTFVRINEQTDIGIDWTYNGWGEKYPPFDADAVAAKQILELAQKTRIESGLILEGGAIDSNGLGKCMTTKRCVTVRNPDWTEDQIKRELAARLGADEILMLEPEPIPGDDTDGHIDQVARFVSENQVVVSGRQFKRVRHQLMEAGLEAIQLPDPTMIRMEGRDLPASYTNFYIVNGAVLVPQFGCESDSMALDFIRDLFPNAVVFGLDSIHLLVGLGSFHCLTQQQPE